MVCQTSGISFWSKLVLIKLGKFTHISGLITILLLFRPRNVGPATFCKHPSFYLLLRKDRILVYAAHLVFQCFYISNFALPAISYQIRKQLNMGYLICSHFTFLVLHCHYSSRVHGNRNGFVLCSIIHDKVPIHLVKLNDFRPAAIEYFSTSKQ